MSRRQKLENGNHNFIGKDGWDWLTRAVSKPKNNGTIVASLLLVVFFWGGNNVGTKWLVAGWPPVFTGSQRLLVAGLILLALLRFTPWLGEFQPLTPALRRALWLKAGLGLASYMVFFNWALRLTSASHVALYLGTSPVWILLAEGRRPPLAEMVRRVAAAGLAVAGVLVLFGPAFRGGKVNIWGDLMGLAASFLWAAYSHFSRQLRDHLNGTEVAAHTMWMAGVWLIPVSVWELFHHAISFNAANLSVMAGCIIFGAVIAYALWNNALRHWPASQVMLFTNLIPLSTSLWALACLREPMTHTFWLAMILIVAGVVLGQTSLGKRTARA
jgi:DME family drug/metabolite transporter